MEVYEQLERDFARWAGCENPVGCSNGTAALHLALEALQLPPGSEVLVPEFTMIACARAVTMAGLRPVFVDCGPDLLMDLREVRASITPATKAILVVHIYGRTVNMVDVAGIAARYNLAIVEDCAEAHGADRGPLGRWQPDARCWSFYRNKIVAGEEGGLVAFAEPAAAQLARQLRCQGFTADHDFLHIPRGHNYRLTNALANQILESLRHADENNRRRLQVAEWFDAELPAVLLQPPRKVCWVYDMALPEPNAAELARVVADLQAQGLAARCGFKPMSQQREYRGHYRHLEAYRRSQQVFYLPVSPTMERAEVLRQAECVRRTVFPQAA